MKKLCLTLCANEIGILKWYMDASYAIHVNCRGHTDAMMTFGNGTITSSSHKQKINARSSTEAELIGVDKDLPKMIWTRYFLEEQGYLMEKTYSIKMTKVP